jgi:3-oxoacyl-[acyl-carrier protein] reductase
MSDAAARVAVVTGASRGIGQSTAQMLERQGFVAVSAARSLPDGERTRRVDVGDDDGVRRMCESVEQAFGRIDVLVNCAGIASSTNALELGVAEWEAVLRTNLIGAHNCCKHVLPAMRRRRFGRIVNVASIAARSFSRTSSVAYTASKYGLVGLTRQLAAAFGQDGVTVNCVAPSQTRTEMLDALAPAQLQAIAEANPLGRLAEPAEVAAAICFLASDGASYINGAVVDVNGGIL